MSTGCWSSTCCTPIISSKRLSHKNLNFVSPKRVELGRDGRSCGLRASMVSSYESSSNFIQRMERAWLISQQPRPVACSSCDSNGHVECKWCNGTGFFILGDNMLCEVPSKNTTCVICAGKEEKCSGNIASQQRILHFSKEDNFPYIHASSWMSISFLFLGFYVLLRL